jgi:hypothetical protein
MMLNDEHKMDAKKNILKELIKEMYRTMFKGKGEMPPEGDPAEEAAESPKMENLEKELGLDGGANPKAEMMAKEDAPADGQNSADDFKNYVKDEMKKGGKIKMPMKTTAIAVKMAIKPKPAAKKYG